MAWREAVKEAAKTCSRTFRILILEVGCGANVTTVRNASEATASYLKDEAHVTLVRINPDFPLTDRLYEPEQQFQHIPMPAQGLTAIKRIAQCYSETRSSEEQPSGGSTQIRQDVPQRRQKQSAVRVSRSRSRSPRY
eukprot:TRINITY_DN12173_c2_g1_i1.p1 TRINITY_DN12173_c2_g1~~TRINITY_DN12173_c2_g1_i1.p1  ORF type:complete len:137 (-),score=17.79 TRINITY_DN12173_c2_g1_i1:65-475(-)